MRHTSPIPDEYLNECQNIKTQKEYAQFYARLQHVVQGADVVLAQRWACSLNSTRQAKAFLQLAVQTVQPDQSKLKEALATEDSSLIAAAAFCHSCCFIDNLDLQKKLLLGSTPWQPSIVSNDGRFQVIKFMGLSGHKNFCQVLSEALLNHGHFCSPLDTAEAMKNLGCTLEPDVTKHKSSISVNKGSTDIIISIDDKFSGSSNCPQCRYFPCCINHYYSGAIEDCRFWNNTNPDDLGEFRDLRHSDKTIDENPDKVNFPDDKSWNHIIILMDSKKFIEAIPLLCLVLLNDVRQRVPAAWVRLADCFLAYNEDKLAFIAMREAINTEEHFLLPQHQNELLQTKLFDNDPKRVLGQDFLQELNQISDNYRKAITYQDDNRYTVALDFYMNENISVIGRYGIRWFEMGECHRSLGELHLAELFMRRASIFAAGELRLNKKFTTAADEVYEKRQTTDDLGLNLERRRKDRNNVFSL